MAKKRKRRRRPSGPSAAGGVTTQEGPDQRSARAERKELARKERERHMRSMRRRAVMRRAVRWGIVVLVVLAIVGFFAWRSYQERRITRAADAAAERLGCIDIEEQADEGQQHLETGAPPPTYGTIPPTSGNHDPSPLPPEPAVYDQAFNPALEARSVHNLEHGYIVIRYAASGPNALPAAVVEALRALAEDEEKVLIAPHEALPEGQSLALTAWRQLQTCAGADVADDAVAMTKGFIQRFRSGGLAPEANAA